MTNQVNQFHLLHNLLNLLEKMEFITTKENNVIHGEDVRNAVRRIESER